MDTKLEKMRGEIRRRVGFAGGLAICLALLLIAVAAGAVPVRLDNPAVSEFISGFRFGVLMALCLYFLWRTAVYLRALRDDGALRRVYNREHDERAGYIQQQVGRSSLVINSALLLTAAVVAGSLSAPVFFTLLAVTAAQGMIKLVLCVYYSRTFTAED